MGTRINEEKCLDYLLIVGANGEHKYQMADFSRLCYLRQNLKVKDERGSVFNQCV